MNLISRRTSRSASFGLIALLMASVVRTARANDYPKRSVMLISPSGAGSGADVIARIVADGLTQLWGASPRAQSAGGRRNYRSAGCKRSRTGRLHTLYAR